MKKTNMLILSILLMSSFLSNTLTANAKDTFKPADSIVTTLPGPILPAGLLISNAYAIISYDVQDVLYPPCGAIEPGTIIADCKPYVTKVTKRAYVRVRGILDSNGPSSILTLKGSDERQGIPYVSLSLKYSDLLAQNNHEVAVAIKTKDFAKKTLLPVSRVSLSKYIRQSPIYSRLGKPAPAVTYRKFIVDSAEPPTYIKTKSIQRISNLRVRIALKI